MEVLLGGITSLLYGAADFLGGEAARRINAASVVFWAGVVSFPIMVAAAVMVGGSADASDYVLGVLAGAAGAGGLVVLFGGLSRGRAVAVAPLSAAVGAIIPVLVALVRGERPSFLAWVGVSLALPAIVLCGWGRGSGPSNRTGVLFGLAAGLGFGTYTSIISFTSPDSSLLPLIASRFATMAVVVLIAGLGVWAIEPAKLIPWRIVASSGVTDAMANVTLLVALRSGSLALAVTASSFYPAVTVSLARVVNREDLVWTQIVGLILTLVALAAIAFG